ncbi:MAG TPA: amidase domain-containing protein [Bacillales bacterium]|nr:amidase domain-containing protein [Bacillales bacterium]
MGWFAVFQDYLRHSARFWVEEEAWRFAFLTDEERKAIKRKKQQLKDRGAQIVKTTVDGRVFNHFRFENQLTAEYALHACHLIKQKNDFYLEEEVENRRATFTDEKLVKDERIRSERSTERMPSLERIKGAETRGFFRYRRLDAVKYADRWWDSHNPAYRAFDVDCTNYISQCLHAGGGPMIGQPNRARGWWYSGRNWSYSWAVAHSLRWYLPGASSGLRARELSSAEQLIPGDVICYDFEGDSVFDHTTIVTAKDLKGMPLVNAHTANCRKHYWDYEDSVAWTPSIRYKFFRITDDD